MYVSAAADTDHQLHRPLTMQIPSSHIKAVLFDLDNTLRASSPNWGTFFTQQAALLDGGLDAWIKAGFGLETGEVTAKPAPLEVLAPRSGMIVSSERLYAGLDEFSVVDARAAERFSGAVEYLDSKAGHIPGSLNRPFDRNLGPDGRFKSPQQLRSEFAALLGNTPPEDVVHSCGSGVTACHNLFAMELAGIGASKLYPGSWSEWIRDPQRPIETGA